MTDAFQLKFKLNEVCINITSKTEWYRNAEFKTASQFENVNTPDQNK